MWPRFSRLRTILYIHFLVTIASVILVRFSLYRHLLYGICGGAGFQYLITWNVPSELRPQKIEFPVKSDVFLFFFSGWFSSWSSRHVVHPVTLFLFFLMIVVVRESGSVPVWWCLTYMYILGYHGCFWFACCRGDSVRVASRVLRTLVTSLLLKFGRLLLGFQGVDEGLDAAFDAAGHTAGHGVWRWRRGGAGTLGGRPCNQTLLIPQLRKENSRLAV